MNASISVRVPVSGEMCVGLCAWEREREKERERGEELFQRFFILVDSIKKSFRHKKSFNVGSNFFGSELKEKSANDQIRLWKSSKFRPIDVL